MAIEGGATSRVCARCKEDKPAEAFKPLGFSYCAPCKTDYYRERRRARSPEEVAADKEKARALYEKNREKRAIRYREWASKPENVQHRKEYHARWRAENPDYPRQYREANPDKILARNLRRYSITIAEYQAKADSQGGVCAICSSPETETHRGTGTVRSLAVDHDHSCCEGAARSCGKCIRGLLCSRCNRVVGVMKDDPALLRRAAEYLESWSS